MWSEAVRSRFVRALGNFSAALAIGVLSMQASYAGPEGGRVVRGDGNIVRPNTTTTNINQSSQLLVINWDSFNIAANETVNFHQPSADAAALNRIFDQNPSEIFGALNANGRVLLVNPNGLLFGKSAAVNVGALIASGLDINTDAFMSGDWTFGNMDGETGGLVVNHGLLQAARGGSISLFGGGVHNTGTIVANYGTVNLAAGEQVTIDFDGDGLINFAVDGALLENAYGIDAAVGNEGTIRADSGRVLLSATSASNVFAQVVNNSGVIQANGVTTDGGRVFLTGSGGDVVNSGTIAANSDTGSGGVIRIRSDADTFINDGIVSAVSAGGNGGDVEILGSRVALLGDAVIDASGATGGGDINIGGAYQGGSELPSAEATVVAPDVRISADATDTGNGGTVIIWADGVTRFYGDISVRGGVNGGDGGFVETSGLEFLEAFGSVDGSARHGQAGAWLLDPRDVTITNATAGGAFDGSDPDTFTPTADNATIDVATIVTALENGTSVIITTGADGTQAGNITVAAAISTTTATLESLTLQAANDIFVNAAITGTGAGLNVILDAAGNVNVAAPISSGAGNVGITADGATGITIAGSTDTSGLIATTTGNISLDATAGSIEDGDDAGPNLQTTAGGTLVLSAAGNIGTTLGFGLDVLGFSDLTITTGGSFDITNDTGLTGLSLTVDPTGTDTYTLTSTNLSFNVSDTGTDVLVTGVSNAAANLNLDITTQTGSLRLADGAVTGIGTGNVTLTSATGQIVDADAGNAASVDTDGSVTLNAAAGIGSAEAIDLSVRGITAGSGSGNIALTNAADGAVTVTDLSVTAGAGNIGLAQTGNQDLSVTNAGTVNGQVDISNAGADLSAAAITAGNNQSIQLATTTSGDILLGSVTATGATITLASAGNIAESIIDGTADVAAATLDASATGSIVLDTTIASLDVTSTGTGDIAITETDGIDIALLDNDSGAVSLTAGGTITTSGDIAATSTVNLTSTAGAVTQSAGTVTASGLLVNAANTSALMQANDVDTFAANISGANQGISLTDADGFDVGTVGATNGITTTDGSVALTATAGDLTQSQNIAAGTGDVTLVATTGAVTQSTGTITAAGLAVNAANSSALGSLNDVDTFAATLTNTSQGVYLRDADGFDVGAVGGTNGITTSDGSVTLDAGSGNLVQSQNIVAGTADVTIGTTAAVMQTTGAITAAGLMLLVGNTSTLTQANDVDTFAASVANTGEGISFTDTDGFSIDTVGATDGVSTAGGAISLTASTGDITLGDDAFTEISAASGSITLEATTGNIVDGMTTDFSPDIFTIGSISLTAGGSIGAAGAGNIDIAGATDVSFDAGDGVYAGSTAALSELVVNMDSTGNAAFVFTAGTNTIDIGEDGANNIQINTVENGGIDFDFTLTTSGGGIVLTDNAIVDIGAGNVSLTTTGAITDAAGGIASIITDGSVSLSGASIGASGNFLNIGEATLGGGIDLTPDSAGAVFIDSVGGTTLVGTGLTLGGGEIRANSPLTISADATITADMIFTAGDGAANGDDDLAFSNDATLTLDNTVAGITLTLQAGDDVIFGNASAAAVDVATTAGQQAHTVIVTADTEGGGADLVTGGISQTTANVDAITNAGDSTLALQLAAGGSVGRHGNTNDLEVEVDVLSAAAGSGAGTGGVFIDETDGVRISSISADGGNIAVRAAGVITLAGSLVTTTSGAISLAGNVNLGADAAVTTAGALATDDITLAGTIDGGQALTLNAGAGDVLLQGVVGGTTGLASLAATGATIDVQAITTTGAQSYTGGTTLNGNLDGVGIDFNNAVTIAGSAVAVNSGTGALTFDSTVAGNAGSENLDVLGNSVTVTGAATNLATFDATGTTSVSVAGVTTTGAQSYTGATTLNGNLSGVGIDLNNAVTIAGSTVSVNAGTGALTFDSTVTGNAGSENLDVLGNSVTVTGAATNLATFDATGTTSVSLAGVTTTGAQSYAGGDGVTFNGAITSNGTISINADSDTDGTGTFTVAAGQGISTTNNALTITAADMVLSGTLDSGAAATSITASNGGDLGIGSGTGDLVLGDTELGSITAAGLALITTGAGDINVAGTTAANTDQFGALTLNGAGGVDVTGATIFADNVEFTGGTTSLSANVTSTTGDLDFSSAATLSADAVVTATAGALNFDDTITGSGAENLTLAAGTTLATADAASSLASFTVSDATTANLDAITTSAAIDITADTINLNDAITAGTTLNLAAANGLTVGNAVNATGATTINADSDNNGAGIFTVNATGSVSTNSNTLAITAADVVLTGALNSGTATTIIAASNGGSIGLGGAAGSLALADAELALIAGTGGITIGSASSGAISADTANFGTRDLTLISGSTIDDVATAGTHLVAGSITLASGAAIGGGAGGVLDIDTATVTVTGTSGNNIALSNAATGGDATYAIDTDGLTGTGAGNISVTQAANDARIDRIETTGAVNVAVTAGAITDASVGEGAGNENIAGATVTLSALSGIGDVTAAGDIDTAASVLQGSGSSLFINEVNGVQLGGASALNATNGALTITAGGSITTGNTIATTGGNGTVTLTTTGAGTENITVTDAITANGSGDVILSADEAFVVNAAVSSATGDVALDAGASITGAGLITGDAVTLSAAGNIGTDATTRLNTAAATLNITVSGTGNSFINEIDNVDLAGVSVGANDFMLTTSGNITGSGAVLVGGTATFDAGATSNGIGLDFAGNDFGTIAIVQAGNVDVVDADGIALDGVIASGTVSITAGGDITDSGSDLLADISGTTVTLATTDGNIGATGAAGSIDIDAATVNATTTGTVGGSIYLNSVSGGVVTFNNVAAAGTGNDVELLADNGIALGSISANDAVSVRATTGDIDDATDDNTADITAASVTLTADAGSIGGGAPTGTAVDARRDIEVSTGTLSLNAANLSLATVQSVSGASLAVSSTGGGVDLLADNTININSLDAGTDDDVTLRATAGSILDAGDDSLADITGGDINLRADAGDIGGVDPIDDGGVDVEDEIEVVPTGTLSLNAGSVFINDLSGNTVTLNFSGDNFSYSSTANLLIGLIDASGTVAVITSGGSINDDLADTVVDINGTSVTLTAATGIGSSETIELRSDAVNGIDASVTGAGGIVLDGAGALVLSDIDTTNGAITVTAAGTIMATDVASLTNADANDITLTSTGAGIVAGTVDAGTTGDVTLDAQGGAITDGNTSTNNITADVLTADATAGIDLDTTVASGNLSTSSVGNILINESNGIDLADVDTMNGSITVTTGGATTITDVQSGNNGAVSITASTGDIEVDTFSSGAGAGNIAATTGSVLDADANSSVTAGALTLTAANGIGAAGFEINTIATGLDASVTAGGDLFVAEIDGIDLADVDTVDGSITITTGGATTITDVQSGNNGAVSITASTGDVEIDTISSGTGAGSIVATAGAITDATDDSDVTAGALTFTAANGIGATSGLAINTTATSLALASTITGSIFINEFDDVTLAGITTTAGTGDFSLSADGLVDQSDALALVGDLQVSNAGNNITLTDAANAVGGDILLTGSNVSITDNGNVSLGASTITGNLAVVGNGTITDVGVVSVAGTTDLEAGGANAITLDGTGTGSLFNSIAISQAGNTTIVDQDALVLGDAGSTVNIGGTLTLTADGISQGNSISTTGALDINSAGFAVTLGNAANSFGGSVAVDGANVTLTDNGNLDFAASTITGNLDATANGTITDSGILAVGGTADFDAGGTNATTNAIALDGTGAGSLFNSVAISRGGNVILEDQNGIQLGHTGSGLLASGTLSVTTTNGAITDGNAVTATGATFAAGGPSSINLDDANDFDSVTVTTASAVVLNDVDGIDLAGITAGAGATIDAGGAITTSGTVTSGANGSIDIATTAGGIVISNAITAGGSGDVVMNAAALLTVNAAVGSTSGDLALTGGTGATFTAVGDLSTGAGGTISVEAIANDVTMADGTVFSAAAGSGTGVIDVTAASDVLLGSLIGGGTVNATATGGAITDVANDAVADIDATTINLVAATGIGVAGANGSIDTDVATVNATNTTSGGIFINSVNGLADVTFGTINAQTAGNIELHDAETIHLGSVTGTGDVLISSAGGSILDDLDDGAVDVSGANITLSAVSGNIGGTDPVPGAGSNDPEDQLEVSASSSLGLAANSVFIDDTSGNASTLDFTGTNFNYSASGDILVGVIDAAGAVVLSTDNGFIRDDGMDVVDINGSSITLSASAGVGDTAALAITTDTLAIDAGGSIDVDNSFATAVTVSDLAASGSIDFDQSGAGSVSITSINATSDVTLTSLAGLTVGNVTAGSAFAANSSANLAVVGAVDAGSVNLDAVNALAINNTITSAGTVNIDSGGITSIAAAGDINAGGAVSFGTTGAGVVQSAGDIVTAGGAVTFNNAITLTGDINIDTTDGGASAAGGGVNFAANLDGSNSLAITAGSAGDVLFGQDVGGTPLAGLAITADRVTFSGSLATTAGGNVTIANAGLLTLNNAGVLNLGGSFNQSGAGDVSLGSDITTSSDGITFNGAVTLTDSVMLDTSGAAVIRFGNTIAGGNNNLGVDAGGSTGIARFDGDTSNVAALSVLAGALADVRGNADVSAGTLDLSGDVDMAGNSSLTATGGTLAIDGDIDMASGTQLVTVNGMIDIGGGIRLTGTTSATLQSGGGGAITIDGAITTAGGGQSLVIRSSGDLDVSTINAGGGDVTLQVDREGDFDFHTLTASTITGRNVTLQGGSDNDDRIDVNTVTANGGGDVTLAGALRLAGDLDVVTNNGDFIATGTLSGGNLLDIDAGTGDASFATVSGLTGVSVDAANIRFNNALNAGAQGITLVASNDVTLAAGTTTSAGGAVNIDNGGTLTINGTLNLDSAFTQSGGTIDLNADIIASDAAISLGGDADIGSGTVRLAAGTAGIALNDVMGSGVLDLDGNGLLLGGQIDVGSFDNTGLGGVLTVAGNAAIATSGNDILLNRFSSIQAASGGGSLDVNAGSGNIVLPTVGSSRALAALAVTAGTLELGDVTTDGDQAYVGTRIEVDGSQAAGNGDLTMSGPIILTGDTTMSGSDITLAGAVDGGFGLALDAANAVRITSAVGATAQLEGLQIDAASGEVVAVTTTGEQSYNADMTVTGNLRGQGITFEQGAVFPGNVIIESDRIGFFGSEGSVTGSGELTLLPMTDGADVDFGGDGGTLDIRTAALQGYDGGLVIGGIVNAGAITTRADDVFVNGDFSVGDDGYLTIVSRNGVSLGNGTISGDTLTLIAANQSGTIRNTADRAGDSLLAANTVILVAGGQVGEDGRDIRLQAMGEGAVLEVASGAIDGFIEKNGFLELQVAPRARAIAETLGLVIVDTRITTSAQASANREQSSGLADEGFIDPSLFEDIALYEISGSGIALPADQSEEGIFQDGPTSDCNTNEENCELEGPGAVGVTSPR